MKLVYMLLAIIVLLALVGVAVGQGTTDSFVVVQTIGRERPRGIQYDPHFDRFVWVDGSDLVLVDASTYEVQHTLHTSGPYNAYRFSHDGRWLALAIERRIELWNTQTGALSVSLEPEGALDVQGPLHFSDDDSFLLFDSVVPAPDNLRRSEFDTVILPWLWDLLEARGEASSRLPRYVEAYPVFNMRNGFILGPNDKAIAALPQRFQIIDVGNRNMPVIAGIPSDRNEPDPISVWFSLRGDQMYVRPTHQNLLVQIDTVDGTLVNIPLGSQLDYRNIPTFGSLVLGDQARIIGEPGSRVGNSFLRLLLGDDYLRGWRYHPLTVTLIDILQPVTTEAGQMGLLVYIFDEQTGQGVIDLVRPVDSMQMVLHPDNVHFMVRRVSGTQPIEVYNLETGALEATYSPALGDPDGSQILAYNRSGDVIISDFQRFDAATGAVIREDLSYHPGFDSYYFTQDSTGLVTLRGSEWWLWDIASGQVIRRETVTLRGSLLDTWPDGQRFLTSLDTPDGPGVEVVNVGTGERYSVIFDVLPDRWIENVIPSPDWLNYLVVYSSNNFGPYYPGNEVALYNLYEGKRWFLAGDDLPQPDGRSYGWLDADTVYVSSEEYGGEEQPTRVYGVEYHASGLPLCLVNNFPDQWTGWVGLWEQLNADLRSDALNRLAQRLCEVLPGAVAGVEAIFHPTPLPTRIPVTATPAFIAGVPACLTTRYPTQSLEYAAAWRAMVEGLTPEQTAEMEMLLCEGLNRSNVPGSSYGPYSAGPNVDVMTIDARTGVRSLGTFLPPVEDSTPSIDLVLDAFWRAYQYTPEGAVLSQDRRFLAVRTRSGYVQILRLPMTYEALAATATTTALPPEDEPNRISVRPTATPPFDRQGGPRPTLTPTVTPTPPPLPVQVVDQPLREQVEEFCPSEPLYHIDSPPSDYSATGRLLVPVWGSDQMWVLEADTGRLYPDETIPPCGISLNCEFSFDQNWILLQTDWIAVSRPDGREAWTLFEPEEGSAWPRAIYWLDPGTLEYVYEGYLPDRSLYPVTLVQRADVTSQVLSEPFLPPSPVTINDLYTETITVQPGGGPLVVARTSFNTGRETGYKYYIYNRDTGAVDYFARLAEYPVGEMTFEWHPLGRMLYYRYPFSEDWYSYDAATGEHRLLGALPGGIWSREGRYRADWYWLSAEERAARQEAGLYPTPTLAPGEAGTSLWTMPVQLIPTPTMMSLFPTPTPAMLMPPAGAVGGGPTQELQPMPKITIWDSETGLVRRYCIPGTGDETYSVPLSWSPDSRYLAFRIRLPGDGQDETVRARTMVLDTETGAVTELTFDVGDVIVWMDDAPEGAR